MKFWSATGKWLGDVGQKILRARPSKKIITALLILLVLFLAYTIYRERETLFSFQWQINWGYLAAAVIVHWFALVLMQINWHWMIANLGGSKSWQKNFYVYGLSQAARRIPAPLFYLGGRFYLYPVNETPPRVIAIATSLEMGLIGLNGILCYLIFMPFYSTIPSEFPWWLFMLIGLVSTAVLVAFPNLFVNLLNLFLHWIRRTPLDDRISRGAILAWLVIYQLVWIVDGLALYLTTLGLIKDVPGWGDVMAVSTLSALVGFISQFLPAGFGLKEMISGGLFSQWIPFGVGIVLAVGFRILMTIVEIIWAWLCRVLWGKQLGI